MWSVRFAAAGTVKSTGSLATLTSPTIRMAAPTRVEPVLKAVSVSRRPANVWVPSEAALS